MGTQSAQPSEKHICAGLLAHVDAGKTTLSESMLYLAGAVRRMGRVDHGDTFLDTDDMERERGITIFSKQARLRWKNTELTLLDTPGHVDFSAEMERALWALDCAVLVISGTEGVQGHTRTLWKLLEQQDIPCILFVNKMDISSRGEEELMEELRRELSENCTDMTGWRRAGLTEGEKDALAMCDEELMEEYLKTGDFAVETLRKAVGGRKVFPCVFGSALKNTGVEELLDALCALTGQKEPLPDFAGRVYKIGRDSQGNRLTYLKLTGGSLRVKDEVSYEMPQGKFTEKVNQIRQYSGERYDTMEEVHAGEICAVTGLGATMPGTALGSEPSPGSFVMESVLTCQVIPPRDCAPHTLLEDLRLLEEEDPALQVRWSSERQEIYVNLMGEVQTQVLQRQIKDRFGLVVTFGPGSILYRETIASTVEGVGHFEPLRHYAEVHVLLEPLPAGSGVEVALDCPTDMLDVNWQRQIYGWLSGTEHIGVLTGSPVTDLHLTLVAGRAHPKHTEGGDFRQAALRAVRQGLMKAKSVLLEPWQSFVLEVPQECVGRAMTDISRMEGEVAPPEIAGEKARLRGKVPAACVGDYAKEVAGYTGGKGRFSLELAGYFLCHNAGEVIEAIGYDSEGDTGHPAGSVFCSHGAGYVVPWYEVEEKMHVPLTGRSDRQGGISGEELSEQEMIAWARERAREQRGGSRRGYDGYGGLESDLEEIFVREFGEIRRKLPSQEKRTVTFEKRQRVEEAREAYRREHGTAGQKQRKRRQYLLVDGYNVIYAWQDLADLARENLEAARGKLTDILCNYQGYLGCELILVFDAYRVKGNPGEVQRYHNIYVVYTKEAETADAYIERTTHEIARECDVTVATSDGLEQMIVAGAGARRLSSRELRQEIERVEREALERYREANERRTVSAGETIGSRMPEKGIDLTRDSLDNEM